MKAHLGTLLAIFAVITPLGVQAASFDCSAHLSIDEQAICGHRDLNDLDVRMATLRQAARPFLAMGARSAFDDAQTQWLHERRRCQSQLACLRQAYRTRIRAIETVLARADGLGPL